MSVAEIEALDLNQYHELEEQRMKNKAWQVAHDLANRLDGAPVLS